MGNTLLTIDEVSSELRIPVATLRDWRFKGSQGPRSFKLGKRIFYHRDDVEAWVQEQRDAAA